MNQHYSVAILGPGGVGGFLAAVFWKNQIPVTCIARANTAKLINEQGLDFKSGIFGDFTAYPRAVAKLDFSPDILFIAVKAFDLEKAVQSAKPEFLKPSSVVIPLLNGLEHMETLRNFYGKRLIAGTISIEATHLAPGRIIHSSPFAKIRMFSEDISKEKLGEIAGLISDCGINVEIGESEAEVLWEKLARLNAIACTTAATDKPIGFLRADSFWRGKLEELISEGVSVAAAEGVKMDPKKIMAKIDGIDSRQMSSMQRDVSQGKECEIDAIAGAIVRTGKRHGIECPTVEYFIEKIKARINTGNEKRA